MQLQFTPPGPVARAFLNDRSEVSGILGPMGSAKTSTTIMKIVALAQEQSASPVPDERFPGKRVRYTKVGIVRETMTNLKRTTIKSIKTWFGRQGRWYGGGGSMEPLSFEVHIGLQDGTVAEIIFEFIGLDGNNIEDLAKGWEITHYWLNEGDLLDPDIKDFLDGRIGRYPSAVHGGCSFYTGLIDFNAPDTENYLYKIFEEEKPEGHTLFRQPGGLDPNAENLENLNQPENYLELTIEERRAQGRKYYERMARGKKKWWIRRNIDAVYGFSREGEPVFEDYNDNFHCAPYDLEYVPGIPIVMYADAEANPGLIFTQTLPNGQRRILDEIYLRGGAVQLGEAVLELRAQRYPGAKLVGGTVDPSADRIDAKDINAKKWTDVLSDTIGLSGSDRFTLAPTNDISIRHDAVDDLLTTVIDGAQPALLVSPRAKVTRKGFNSTYCFKRRANGTTDDKPTKDHPVSDLHDATQYYALDQGGYEKTTAREARHKRQADFSRPRTARMEFSV